MKPDVPAPRLRRALRLKTLKQRRERWAEARAARKALFARPTPVADRVQLVARLHKLIDYGYFVLCVLLGIRILAQVFGYRDLSVPFDLYTLLELPLLSRIQAVVPPVAIGPNRQLDVPALFLLLSVSLIIRAAHALVRLLARRVIPAERCRPLARRLE